MQIVPDEDESAAPSPPLPTDGTAFIKGQLGSLAGAFSRMDRLTNSVDTLSAEWRLVGANLNKMLEGRGPGGASLPEVVVGLEQRLDEMKQILDGARRYTDNDELYENVTATVANSRAVSERAATIADETRTMIANTEASMDELATRYLVVAEETAATLSQMQQVLAAVLEGEGTAGKLIRDPELFDNWAGVAERVSALADELNLLVQKWKAEGLPVKF